MRAMATEGGVIARWREALAAVRETLVIAVVLALLAFPAFIGNKLRDMGVETVDVGGVEIAVTAARTATRQAVGQLKRDSVAVDTVLLLLRALRSEEHT